MLWAGIEEAVIYTIPVLEPGKELVAGLGSAAAFSAVTRLGMRAGSRAVILGGTVGGLMSVLRVFQARLGERVGRQKEEPTG